MRQGNLLSICTLDLLCSIVFRWNGDSWDRMCFCLQRSTVTDELVVARTSKADCYLHVPEFHSVYVLVDTRDLKCVTKVWATQIILRNTIPPKSRWAIDFPVTMRAILATKWTPKNLEKKRKKLCLLHDTQVTLRGQYLLLTVNMFNFLAAYWFLVDSQKLANISSIF